MPLSKQHLTNENHTSSRAKHPPRELPDLDIPGGEKIRHAITIGRSPEEIYAFWRDFSHLPFFFKDLSEVNVISPVLSHWVVRLESGLKVEWDAEIVAEEENRMIAWQSVKDSEVSTSGAVVFEKAPANLGTVVRLTMNHAIPGGRVTEFATKLLGEDPDTLVITNLHRLKAYLETGEIPTVQGQPSGRDENSFVIGTH